MAPHTHCCTELRVHQQHNCSYVTLCVQHHSETAEIKSFPSSSSLRGMDLKPTRPSVVFIPLASCTEVDIIWLRGHFFRHAEALVSCSLVPLILSVHFYVNKASNYVLMFSSTAAKSSETSPEEGLVVTLTLRGHLIIPKYLNNSISVLI